MLPIHDSPESECIRGGHRQAKAGRDGQEGRGCDQGARHAQHQDRRLFFEEVDADDFVADGVCHTRTASVSAGRALDRPADHSPDQHGAEKFTHGRNTHGLPQGQGPRGHRGCKRVGHIVGTDVERIQKGKNHANGEDVIVLVKGRHDEWRGVGISHWSR